MKVHHMKGNYLLRELVIVELFDHSTRENSEGSKGSVCDKDNAMASGEDKEEDGLHDNLEDKKDVDYADAEGNKNLAFKSERQNNVEDFEEYKKSDGLTDESTGCDGHHEGSISDDSVEGQVHVTGSGGIDGQVSSYAPAEIVDQGDERTQEGGIVVEGGTDGIESEEVAHSMEEVIDEDIDEGVCLNKKAGFKAKPKAVRKSTRKRNAPKRL
jgi:hypothetical protein